MLNIIFLQCSTFADSKSCHQTESEVGTLNGTIPSLVAALLFTLQAQHSRESSNSRAAFAALSSPVGSNPTHFLPASGI